MHLKMLLTLQRYCLIIFLAAILIIYLFSMWISNKIIFDNNSDHKEIINVNHISSYGTSDFKETKHINPVSSYNTSDFKEIKHTVSTGTKTILLWNSFWDEQHWGIGLGDKIFKHLGCEIKNCLVTEDKQFLSDSDAVLFHIQEISGIPPVKRKNQKFVFFMLENPGWSQNYLYQQPLWKDVFDWSLTYRLDSTIHLPYGSIKRRDSTENLGRATQFVTDNRKLVAIMSRNCHPPSQRDKYIQQLSRYIPIDHYGPCGTLECPKNLATQDEECMSLLNSTYKFYLAFENAFCYDYVTEKFFKVLPLDVVPVIRGGANYSKFGSLNWYIDTADFKSAKALAEYLLYLDKNPQEYNKYLQNRQYYHLRAYYGLGDLPSWCQLCEFLNNKNKTAIKSVEDVSAWWGKQDCYAARDLDHYTDTVIKTWKKVFL